MNDDSQAWIHGYLDGTLTDAEFAAFSAWLRDDPRNAHRFADVALLHNRLAQLHQGPVAIRPPSVPLAEIGDDSLDETSDAKQPSVETSDPMAIHPSRDNPNRSVPDHSVPDHSVPDHSVPDHSGPPRQWADGAPMGDRGWNVGLGWDRRGGVGFVSKLDRYGFGRHSRTDSRHHRAVAVALEVVPDYRGKRAGDARERRSTARRRRTTAKAIVKRSEALRRPERPVCAGWRRASGWLDRW
jgi:hypothetical protein